VAEGHQAELYDLKALPPDFLFTDMFGERSEAFRAIEQLMRQASRFVFVAPEYNGSIPGVVKLFIDAFVPKEVFHGKKAGLIGLASGKFGNVRGLDHLTGILNYLQVDVMPFKAHIPRIHEVLSAAGELTDAKAQEELREHARRFARF